MGRENLLSEPHTTQLDFEFCTRFSKDKRNFGSESIKICHLSVIFFSISIQTDFGGANKQPYVLNLGGESPPLKEAARFKARIYSCRLQTLVDGDLPA